MNNFYTTTVYEKGAEVVRMINTIVGDKTFAAGLKLYLSKFDGKAATVEDFIGCFEILGQKSFTQFMNRYSTPGTPVISIKENKVEKKSLTVSFEQKISNQVLDTLLEIPLRISWVSSKGMLKFHAKLKLAKFSEILNCNESEILFILKDKYVEMDISFENECDLPVISLNRHFSAPVIS